MSQTLFTALITLAFTGTAATGHANCIGEEAEAVVPENVIVDSRPLSSEQCELMQQIRAAEFEACEKLDDQELLELTHLMIPIKYQNLAILKIPIKNQTETEQTSEELAGLSIPIKHQNLAFLKIPIKNHTETGQTSDELAGLSIPIKHQNLACLAIPIKNQNEEALFSEEISELDSTTLAGLWIPIKHQNFTMLSSDFMRGTASSYTPAIFHWIEGFPQHNLLKLEDGSEWIFDDADAFVIRSWEPGDTIVLSPKGGMFWGSNFGYILANKSLGSSVSANPYLGPVKFGPNSTWVAGINRTLGQVYLLNGKGDRTVWEVSPSDMYLFKDWAVNDAVIIGENDSWLWWLSSYNSIVFNVNMNHYVRSRQVSSTPHFNDAVSLGG